MKELIATYEGYGVWASERLLAKAASLSPSQLTQRFSTGADPILPTFAHLVGADLRWLARCRGETPPPMLTVAELPTIEAVRARWTPLHAERRAYVESLDEAALRAPMVVSLDGETIQLARWQGMMQCANHGTQHRSEIAAMLSDLGQSPGNLDFVFFCVERR